MPVPKGTRIGGRAKGTPNKATAEVRDIARQYAPSIVAELARLAHDAESEQARVAAGREILDRAYGRAPQAVDMALDGELRTVIEVIRGDNGARAADTDSPDSSGDAP